MWGSAAPMNRRVDLETLDKLHARGRLEYADWLVLRAQYVAVQTASDERPPRSLLNHSEWANLLFIRTLADALARAGGRPPPDGEARRRDEELLESFESAVMALHERDLANRPGLDGDTY
jgi:hypothetical protein